MNLRHFQFTNIITVRQGHGLLCVVLFLQHSSVVPFFHTIFRAQKNMAEKKLLPVTILSGFLGSGKTTLFVILLLALYF